MFDATNSLADARVNLFANAYKPVPAAILMLAEAIQVIRGGRYQREVCEVRQVLAAKGKRTYDKAKATIPAFTFAGTFSPSRANEHLQQHAGIAHGDMDYVEDMAAAKRRICSDLRTAYAFDSPGGQGLKVGVRVLIIANDAAYKHVWRIVSAEYERLYRGKWDVSGKDISRLCFASWDPAAYWNPEAEVFEVPPPPIQESPAPTSLQPSTSTHTIDRSDDYAVRAIKTAVQMIEASELGTRHHTRLKAARLLGGYIGGGLLSYEQAYTVLAQALVGHTDDLERSLKTVKDGLAYGAAPPITLKALEAERQAWLEAHHSPARQGHASPVSDPWEGRATLPIRPYTGYCGQRYSRGVNHGS